MPCQLHKTGVRTFSGKTGQTVKLSVDSDSGAAFIVSVVYAGTAILKPWESKIVAGSNTLEVLVEDPNAGDPVRINEICSDGTKNVLVEFDFDPGGPTQIVVIQGE